MSSYLSISAQGTLFVSDEDFFLQMGVWLVELERRALTVIVSLENAEMTYLYGIMTSQFGVPDHAGDS